MIRIDRRYIPVFPVALLTLFLFIPLIASAKIPQESLKVLKQFFEARGFKTGNIDLPNLSINVHLDNDRFYKKEEGVGNIYQRINEIRSSFGLPVPYAGLIRCCGWCGIVDAECNGQKAYGYVILIKKNLNSLTRIYTQAHENGHFLWYIGEQEKVFQKFKNSDYIRSNITANDDFAELCGWLALKLSGYDLNKCSIQWSGNQDSKKSNRIKEMVRKNC